MSETGGTIPAPGEPAEGNTVPCWRLAVFGCRAEGPLEEEVVVPTESAAGRACGKLSGGFDGGGVSKAPSCCDWLPGCPVLESVLLPRELIRGREAAAAGGVRRRAE